jgi:predicted small secreted protein
MRHVRKLVVWCLLVALGVAVVGCNTIRGAGRDIEKAGEAIQDAVQ